MMGKNNHIKRVMTGYQPLRSACTILFYLFTFLPFYLSLSSCGGNNGVFKLEGHFKNMNQGELYLYDINNGEKDTIRVMDGRFAYQKNMTDTTTLILLFPNYSELPIMARGGASVEIEGDVSHLKETEIKGTDENEEMTAFRLKANSMVPPEVKKEAARFIRQNPSSAACHYLLRRYFILTQEPDYEEAYKLCTAILKAQPSNRIFVRLRHQLEDLKALNADKLPNFTAVSTKGDSIISCNYLNNHVNIIHVWANWNHDSQNAIAMLHRLQKDHHDSISVMTISMDATPAEGRYTLERDSISWPNICDGLMWQSPLVSTLSINSIPANIVTDKEGKIVGRNLKKDELEQTIRQLLQKNL